MIIYIHGFGGSGKGVKASEVKNYFKDRAISPSLSYVPDLAISTLEEIIESFLKHEEVHLIGSSLGGYYSAYLGNKYNLKTVLLNPSVFPHETLKNFLGDGKNFYDSSSFGWNEEHIKTLKKYEVKTIKNEGNFFLLAQKGDELLDYKKAEEKFKKCSMILDEGGNHSFVDFDEKLPIIENFFFN